MDVRSETPVKRSARERLLGAADELFYEHGINTVGIDRVIEHAGVAKASLYDCFGSKEELVAAYLRRRQEVRKARMETRLAQIEEPREKILGVFDLLGEVVTQPQFRGCAFVRASAEVMAGGKIKSACEESRAWMLEMFTTLARNCGVDEPEVLGKQLMLLYDGASIAAHVDRNREAANEARALAARLLTRSPPSSQRAERGSRARAVRGK